MGEEGSGMRKEMEDEGGKVSNEEEEFREQC